MNRFMLPILLIGGGISSFAYSPFDYIPLLFIGYFVLFYALYKANTIKEHLYYGFLFGLAHFLVGTYWLFSIVKASGTTDALIFTLIIIGIILILALYFSFLGILVYLSKKISSFNLWGMLLLFPVLATFVEWLKSWFLTGFTWLSPADTLFNFGFAHLLPIVGTLGVSFIFYLLVALLLFIFIKRTAQAYILFFVIIITISISLYLLEGLTFTIDSGRTLNTQIVQANFSKLEKIKRYKVIERIEKFQNLALQEPCPELSVWSESTVSLEYNRVENHIQNGFKKLREKNIEVLYGAYNHSKNVVMQNSTNSIAYTKQHLMPFGEYTPRLFTYLKSFIPSFNNSSLIEGDIPHLIDVNKTKIAASICYELLFPNELRKGSQDANFLLHISDLSWFDRSWAQSYLLNLARMRSMEHQKPMVYVVNHGYSAFISYEGEIIQMSTQAKGTHIFYHKVQIREGVTPYIKYGNLPILILITVLFLIYLIGGRSDVLSNKKSL